MSAASAAPAVYDGPAASAAAFGLEDGGGPGDDELRETAALRLLKFANELSSYSLVRLAGEAPAEGVESAAILAWMSACERLENDAKERLGRSPGSRGAVRR